MAHSPGLKARAEHSAPSHGEHGQREGLSWLYASKPQHMHVHVHVHAHSWLPSDSGTTATGPAAAGRAKGQGLSFFSEDSHNVILDTLGANACAEDEAGG